MRSFLSFVVFVISLTLVEQRGFAQAGPKLQEIDGFMAKGAFTALDVELVKHRLSLREIEESHLDGKSTGVRDVLGLIAKYEKLRPRVDEPLEVRGEIPVFLPLNTIGDEAYTTCFYALTFNGLVLAGSGDELVLVRPETRPELARPERPWNRDQILSTRLFRLGYLNPDPIMRQYHDKLGTAIGHAVLDKRSNILLVNDRTEALDRLHHRVDSEILEGMGVAASEDHAPGENPRSPSFGAIVSRESIHFYLMAYARWSRIPLAASADGVLARHYPEADLWTDERGFRALENEYKRVNEFVRLARQTGGQGWDDPDPERDAVAS